MRLSLQLPHTTTTTHPLKLYFAITQLAVVRLEHVRSLFDSSQSQESKSEVGSRNGMWQCALGPILRPPVYLWCHWSNLNMRHHFLHLQNLRFPNLRSASATEHDNVL